MKLKSLILFAFIIIALAACGTLDAAPESPTISAAETKEDPVETTTSQEAQVGVPEPSVKPKPQPAATEIIEVNPTPTVEPAVAELDAVNDLPPAKIVNDEGGPVSITGEVNYTNLTFTDGVAEPVVILEDQAGFIDRNEFFIMPVESQTLGQITSDFFVPPFSYSIALPIEPRGTLRDVDNDYQEETGIQVFAIAYWTNSFGDPFLEARDLMGGGWSTAYASTLTSPDAETKREITGGKLLVYAPEEGQGFPSGFGDDGLLFSEDDPLVALPQGYTVVDLDTDPFTFDRSRHPVIDLIEPETTALVDYSNLSYTEAFDLFIEKLIDEYAFTEFKGIDWEQIKADLRPLFEEADEKEDGQLYRLALRDLARSIPDGHISGPFIREEFLEETSGGLGIAIRELDDGRVLVNFLTPGSPAEEAGIELQAEILAVNGVPVGEVVSAAMPHSAPFSTEHVKRLQQLRYATRFPVGTEVSLSYRNPGSGTEQTVELTAIQEAESFRFSSLSSGLDGFELPVEYELLPGGQFGYVKIHSFNDNDLLSIQLWERMIKTLKEQNVPGLIIDMRQNRGGSGFLADSMAAYFFDETHILGNSGHYDEELDDFFYDSRGEQRFHLPPEELQYNGEVAVLVGPNCNSACEFFSYDMTIDDRAAIVGQYPTAGLGGSIERVRLPEGEIFQFTSGRAVDANGEIHIEGKGVIPTVQVPINEETLFSNSDPILEAAVRHLAETLTPEVVDMGLIHLGDIVGRELEAGKQTQFTLDAKEGQSIDILISSEDFDPSILIYDVAGNLLAINDNLDQNSNNAGFTALEIPIDLTLVLQVIGPEQDSTGSFTISINETES